VKVRPNCGVTPATHAQGRAVLVYAAVVLPEQCLLAEDGDLAKSIEVVGDRRSERLVDSGTGIHVACHHHPVRLGHPEGLEENAPNDRKESCVGADADC
jgi:hypothetical protein